MDQSYVFEERRVPMNQTKNTILNPVRRKRIMKNIKRRKMKRRVFKRTKKNQLQNQKVNFLT